MRPTRHPGLSPADTDLAYAAAQRVVQVHQHLSQWMKEGMTLGRIDTEVARVLDLLQCRSAFIGYKMGGKGPSFPSHACLSVNDCVVHGTAASLMRPIQQGDLVKIDIGVYHRGFIGDAAWTYHVGKAPEQTRRLMECGKKALAEGVKQLRPGNVLMAWAAAVQKIVEHDHGYHLVRGLGGHGYGRTLHGPPYVSNVVPQYPGDWDEAHHPCVSGMLLAVEPMIAVGTSKVVSKKGTWPVLTDDGSTSVHYEHDVLVTHEGPRILTEGIERTPDEI